MTRNNYKKRNHFVYVLRLQDGKKYVGRTSNLRQRLNQHFSGDGSEWTKRYLPISVEYTQRCKSLANSKREETNIYRVTKNYYGKDNVRGAGNTKSY